MIDKEGFGGNIEGRRGATHQDSQQSSSAAAALGRDGSFGAETAVTSWKQ